MATVAWQKAEGWIVFCAALAAAIHLRDMPWWLFVALALAPDLLMIGYAAGPRVGAVIYNLGHLYAFGAVVAGVGAFIGSGFWLCAGLLFLAHAAIDRALGFGLKEPTGFKDTHLGRLP